MMMDDANEASPTPGLSQSSRIPIAQISPTKENISQAVIHATVSLLWPYSSSTKSLSLLLAEPDFRLRRSNGQVKVVFNGHIAESVAASKLGIGDDVQVCLNGAKFVSNEAATQTPGKCVTWDLHFDDRVQLEVFRNSERLATVKVDPSSSPLPDIRVTSPTPVTPTPKNNSAIDGIASAITGESWQSPAFLGRTRTSFGALVDSAYDPFADEDGYVPGKGRKRARFSMRGSDWRVIDEPESPGEKDMPVDWFQIFDEEEANGSGAEEDTTVHAEQVVAGSPQHSNDAASDRGDAMDISAPTPANDVTTTTESSSTSDQHVEASKDGIFRLPDRQTFPSLRSQFPIDTPRLHPIPSPGLPIPSPLVTTTSNQQGYFGSAGFAGHSQTGPVSAIFSQSMEQQDINASHVLSQTSQTGLFGHVETAPECTHLGQDTEASGVSIAAEAIQFSEVTTIDGEVVEQPPQVMEATAPRESKNGEVEVEDINALEESDVQELDPGSQQENISEGSENGGEEEESHGLDFDHKHEGREEEEGQEQAVEVGSNAREHRTSSMAESYESEDDMDSEEAQSFDEQAHAPHGQQIDLTAEKRPVSEEHDALSKDEEDDDMVEDEDEDAEDDEDEMDDEPTLYGAGRGREVESMDEDEYDEEEEYESEYEFDEMSVDNDNRPPPPPKTVHPEVIVLDSDSEDDTPPSRATIPAEQRELTTNHDRRRSFEEESVSGESYSSSEAEDWSEADGSRQHEYVGSELEDEQQDEAKSVDEFDDDENAGSELEDEPKPAAEVADNSREDEHVESKLEEGRQPEAELVDESSEDEHVESELGEERQSKAEVVDSSEDELVEAELKEERRPEPELVDESSEDEHGGSELEGKHQREAEVAEPPQENEETGTSLEEKQEVDVKPEVTPGGDQTLEAENVEDEWPKDEHVEDRPMYDEHVEDEQIVEAHSDQNFNVEADIGVLPEDNEGSHDVEVQNAHGDFDNTAVTMPASHQEVFDHGAYVPSIDQPHATSESLQHDSQMAIDPELFNLAPVSGVNYGENQTQQQHDEHVETSEEKLSIKLEQEKEDCASLTMDGSSALPPVLQDVHDSSAVLSASLQHEQQPILTPEPSQSVDVNNDTPVELVVTEMPPTPVDTQEVSTQEKEHLQSLQAADPIPSVATEPEEPSTDEDPENTEVAHISPEGPHESVEVSVHETEAPATPENQTKQPHTIIDDDDSIDTIDSIHLVSVDRHYPGLRSKLSYFAPLATLIDHFNSLIDTISVVSEIHPVIQGTKRKDYMITLGLTDPSMAGTTLNAQLIRPWKAALPSPEEGDSILLRNFQVRSYDRSMILVSGETSSWAVFSRSKVDAQVDGPPVEYGAEEQTHATGLRKWYQETGMAMVADFQLQASIQRASREGSPASSAILSDSGSLDSVLRDQRAESSVSTRSSRRSRKSHRRITIHELRDGTRYTEVGSPSGKDSIHELRDGTVYAHQ